jgi:hypothetical protein
LSSTDLFSGPPVDTEHVLAHLHGVLAASPGCPFLIYPLEMELGASLRPWRFQGRFF